MSNVREARKQQFMKDAAKAPPGTLIRMTTTAPPGKIIVSTPRLVVMSPGGGSPGPSSSDAYSGWDEDLIHLKHLVNAVNRAEENRYMKEMAALEGVTLQRTPTDLRAYDVLKVFQEDGKIMILYRHKETGREFIAESLFKPVRPKGPKPKERFVRPGRRYAPLKSRNDFK